MLRPQAARCWRSASLTGARTAATGALASGGEPQASARATGMGQGRMRDHLVAPAAGCKNPRGAAEAKRAQVTRGVIFSRNPPRFVHLSSLRRSASRRDDASLRVAGEARRCDRAQPGVGGGRSHSVVNRTVDVALRRRVLPGTLRMTGISMNVDSELFALDFAASRHASPSVVRFERARLESVERLRNARLFPWEEWANAGRKAWPFSIVN